MYHVTTCALDQGGVEPRLAVSLRSKGHRQYHYTTAPASDWITTGKPGTSAEGRLVRGEVGGRKLDFGRKKPGGAWQKAALRPERCEKGWCSRSSCA